MHHIPTIETIDLLEFSRFQILVDLDCL